MPFTQRSTLSETFYDDYNALPSGFDFVPNDVAGTHAASNKNRITLQKTAILLPDSTISDKMLTAVLYYDDYGRLVQSLANNHLDGIDRVSIRYDFRGNVLQSLQESSWTDGGDEPQNITLLQTINYDALKRPTSVKLSINEGQDVTISQSEYDELVRLSKKKLHDNTETIAYTYNIQNWLKKIQAELFTEELFYEQPTGGVAAQFNGNISGVKWETTLGGSHAYAFVYDGASRLRDSRYAAGTNAFGDLYTEKLNYDKNGNITSLQRYGAELIDDLTYNYTGNQATKIVDAATLAGGLPNGNTDYAYDVNGNMIDDDKTQIKYNLLNLPRFVQLIGQRSIANTYAADGRKLFTEVREGTATENGTKYYNGNLVFDKNKELEYILFDEGRIVFDDNNFTFEYHLRDHLGSVRVAFEPITSGKTVVQENAYYPFGFTISDLSYSHALSTNRYGYNGKELIEDFEEMRQYDYDARFYNSLTARWSVIDPLAEKYNSMSPYAYCLNSPILYVDKDGREIVNSRNMVLSNKTLMQQLRAFDRAVARISGKDVNSYSFVISGGDRYKKDGKIYSATNHELLEESANKSLHLQEEGAMGVDLAFAKDISYDVIKEAAAEVGMRIDPGGTYKTHFHLDMRGYEGTMEYAGNNYKPTNADFNHAQDISTEEISQNQIVTQTSDANPQKGNTFSIGRLLRDFEDKLVNSIMNNFGFW